MKSSPGLGPAARFGAFEVDLRAGELRKHGIKIKLQDQPFQILALLLVKPGEVVTREELRQKLWSADTFGDFDHGSIMRSGSSVRHWVIRPTVPDMWKLCRGAGTG